MSVNDLNINADPTKEFFIDMLTRDISLTDCILDLIDNSVDSIIQKNNFDPMKGLFKKPTTALKNHQVTIFCSKGKFTIEDNSTGLDPKEVENNSFRFGKSVESRKKEKGKGLSVYGIGMKRAFLKMGKDILFESTSVDGAVKVNIDVNKWVKEKEDWGFKGEYNNIKSKKTGTKIEVKKLNEEIAFNFGSEAFKTRLLQRIGEVYGIFLLNGLVIKLNNKKAEPRIPKVAHSSKLKPSIETYINRGVKVKIIAGISHEGSKDLNGWYIFCNGRLILSGDKTEKTGWGNGMRKFHPSTNRFAGYVYFESENVTDLPWTTTKDSVNYDSIIYQHALKEMVKMANPVVGFLAKQYTQDTSLAELSDLIKDTKEVSMENIKVDNQKFTSPIINSIKKTTKEKILYFVSKQELEKARNLFGDSNLPKNEVGKQTFDYYIDHEE